MTNSGRMRAGVAMACLALWWLSAQAAGPSPAAMATAASALLSSLTPAQRQQVAFPLDGAERLRWHFVPTEMHPRNGLTLKAMTEPQRALARTLLEAGLSARGYRTITSTMANEALLGALEVATGSPEARRFERDVDKYFVAIFGTPSATGTWGWRFEGHHVSLHYTVVNGTLLSAAPTFVGANPAEVKQGSTAGQRLLAAQEDSARSLLVSLDATQRAQAVFNTAAPNDIVTMNQNDIAPLTPPGLKASAMTVAQRTQLMAVIEAYTGLMAADVAEARQASLRNAGLDRITFAWAGAAERGARHYYRVQGPTFLIEYDNTQNDANHIHSVWRDFAGDFGRDLLREHLAQHQH